MFSKAPVKKRVAILISGRGSNMVALIQAARDEDYPAEIVTVISNRPEAAGLAVAAKFGIPTTVLDHKSFPLRAAFDRALHVALLAAEVDYVACAGFLRLLTPHFVDAWQNKILNIHPSLLPAFKGLDTHARALEAGVTLTGCTVHLVSTEVDSGPILAQAAVPVVTGDTPETLGARVLRAEHILYPATLARFATGSAPDEASTWGSPPVLMSPGYVNRNPRPPKSAPPRPRG